MPYRQYPDVRFFSFLIFFLFYKLHFIDRAEQRDIFLLTFANDLTILLNNNVYQICLEMNGHNNTEQAILEAAESLFFEKGYKLATTTAIAARAGVTHAMLHYYFRTKEQIFLKVLDKNMNGLFDMMHTVMSPELTFSEILVEVVNLNYTFLASHSQLPALLFEIAGTCPEMLTRYKERFREVLDIELRRHRDRFEREVKAGTINPIDPFQLLFMILSMNLSTYLALPVMRNVFGMDEGRINAFIEERRGEILRTLSARLFGNDFSEVQTEKK